VFDVCAHIMEERRNELGVFFYTRETFVFLSYVLRVEQGPRFDLPALCTEDDKEPPRASHRASPPRSHDAKALEI